MIRITYDRGNGYYCGCCRSTSTHEIDCQTMEEMTKEITKLEFAKKVIGEDVRITNIAIVRDIERDKWVIDQKYYEQLEKEHLDDKKKQEEEQRAEELEYKRQELERLKKELEES